MSVLLVSVALGLPRLAADDGEDLRQLRAQIDALEQKVRVLEQKQKLKDEDAAAAAKSAPKVSLTDRGLTLASADGANSVGIGGLVQIDAREYFGDGGVANNSFVLRRARLISQGTLGKIYSFQISPELGGSTVSVVDAYLNIAPAGEVQFRFGRFKTPIGLEFLQSDSGTFFLERSLATDLVPNRDLGAQVWGTLGCGIFSYAAGIFNGVADGANTSNADFDNDKDVYARVFAQPFVNDGESRLQGLGFGISGGIGREKGASGVTAGYKTEGQQTFFKYNGTVVGDGRAWRVSPQASYYHGPFGAIAEYVVSTVNARPAATGAKAQLQNRAWQVAAGWVLTGEDATINGVTPAQPFNWANGTWGAWQVAVRCSGLKIDPKAFPAFAPTAASAKEASAFSVGLNWYLSKTVRLTQDYFQTHFTPAGTTAPAAPILRQDEKALITRVQLSF